MAITRYPLDVTVHAGEPLDVSVPVLDAAGLPVALSGGWTATAQIRHNPRGDLLHTFTPAVEATSVRLTATAVQTRGWADTWATPLAAWDVVLTDPAGTPHVLGPGRIQVISTITH